MNKYEVTRNELTTFTIEVYAETYEQAERLAKGIDIENKRWHNKGYNVDYVVFLEEGEEDE